MIKRSIEDKAFQNLMTRKQTHSKVNDLNYEKLEIQSYFLSNKSDCSKEDIQLIFKIRSHIKFWKKVEERKKTYQNKLGLSCAKLS